MSEGPTNRLVERVEFEVVAPKVQTPGLDAAIKKLERLDTVLQTVNNRLSGFTTGSIFKLTATQFASKIPSSGPQDVRKLARLWGFPDIKDVQAVAREIEGELQKSIQRIQRKLERTPKSPRGSTRARDVLKKQIEDLQAQSLFTGPDADSLKNPTRAGQFAELYAKRALVNKLNADKAIIAMLTGSSSVPSGGQSFPIQAPVPSIPSKSKTIKTSEGGAETKAAAAKGARAAAAAFADAMEKIKLELARNINSGDLAMVSAARRRAAEQVTALVEGDKGTLVKERTKDKALRYAADEERKSVEAQQAYISGEGANTFKVRKKLEAAEKKGQKEKVRQLQEELKAADKADEMARLGRRGSNSDIDRQAALAMEDLQFHAKQKQRQEGMNRRAAVLQAIEDFKKQGGEIFPGQRMGPKGEEGRYRGRMRMPDGTFRMLNATVKEDDAKMENYLRPSGSRGPKDRWQSAVEGLSVRNMAANVLKVTEWAAAVGVLYKSVEIAEYSLKRMIDTGAEMAHLSVIFRGVGGDVKALTRDVIELAAQEGRGTTEAMESAAEWARLGGDRKTVLEEVRVSALAANVANMHMGETTKQLMSLMHIYHLEASDLNNTLAMLVNTSLKYNVTLEELFTGLDRSAAAAKVAGIGLAELQAMIGVVVGATGQTGSMTGSSLKYIFQELNKSEVQKQLRGFGIETLGNNLEQKPGGQIFGDLSTKWGTMGQRAQQQLSGLLGGRFNASRVPIVLEEYPKILQLAIDAQLNLNKAQDANAKILQSLKAQLAGVRSEWDKFVVNSGLMGTITEVARTGKNLLGSLGGDAEYATGKPVKQLSDAEIRNLEEGYSNGHGPAADAWKYGVDYRRELNDEKARRAVEASKKAGRGFWSGMFHEGSDADMISYFNQWSEYTPAPAGQDSFETKLADLQKNVSVSGLMNQQFDIGRGRLANGTMNQEHANIVADAMQKMGSQDLASRFLTTYQRGDNTGASAIIGQAQKQNNWTLAQQKLAEKTLVQNRMDELQKNSGELSGQIAEAEKAGQSHEKLDEQLRSNNEAMAKAKDESTALANAYQALVGEIDDVREAQSRYGSLMKSQEGLMQQMHEWVNAVPSQTPLQALAREAETAQIQLDFLTKAKQRFDDSHPTNLKAEDQGLKTWYLEHITDAEQRRDAANDPMRQAMAARQTSLIIGTRSAQNLQTASDYGVDPAAKLLQQRQALTEDLARTTEQLAHTESGSLTEAELRGRQMQEQAALYQTLLDLSHRRAEVERDIRQLAIDQNREFMRAFIGSGPAEMLQKLTAFKMAFNTDGSRKPGLSQGAFFALSPELRGDYGMLNPQYNPDMLQLKNELRRVTGRGFAGGGYTGDGPSSEVAGVVHKGEYVVPARDVDRWRNGPPTSAVEWDQYNTEQRNQRWQQSVDRNAKITPAQSLYDVHPTQQGFYDWSQKSRQGMNFNELNAAYTRGDRERSEQAWKPREAELQALNAAAAAARQQEYADMVARNQKIKPATSLYDIRPPGGFSDWSQNARRRMTGPQLESAYNTAGQHRRDEAWQNDFGGPDWRDKQDQRKAASDARIAEWRKQRDAAAAARAAQADAQHQEQGDVDLGDGRWRPNGTTPTKTAETTQPAVPKGPGYTAPKGTASTGGGGGGGGNEALPTSIAAAAQACDALAASANRATAALNSFASKLESTTPGFQLPQSPQAGGLGGGRGYSK